MAVAPIAIALVLLATACQMSGNRRWDLAGPATLGVNYVSIGDQVGLWQSYQLAYNLIPCSGMDGRFGAQAEFGTRALQSYFWLPQDGIVGPDSWRAASDNLEQIGTDPTGGTFFSPRFSQGPFVPIYWFQSNGIWRWQVPAATHPFEAWVSSDYGAITYGLTC